MSQFLKHGIGLAGKSDDERRTKKYTGDLRADPFNQLGDVFAITQPMHALQHAVADMLQRHVEILRDTRRSGIQLQQLIRDLLWIQIEGSDPSHIIHRDQLTQQGRESLFEAQIHPVVDRVLRDQVEFLHTFLPQPLRLRHDRVDRAASLLAPHDRNGAERTVAVTAFGNFEVGAVGRPQPDARRLGIVQVGWLAEPDTLLTGFGSQEAAANLGDTTELARTDHPIQFREFL